VTGVVTSAVSGARTLITRITSAIDLRHLQAPHRQGCNFSAEITSPKSSQIFMQISGKVSNYPNSTATWHPCGYHRHNTEGFPHGFQDVKMYVIDWSLLLVSCCNSTNLQQWRTEQFPKRFKFFELIFSQTMFRNLLQEISGKFWRKSPKISSNSQHYRSVYYTAQTYMACADWAIEDISVNEDVVEVGRNAPELSSGALQHWQWEFYDRKLKKFFLERTSRPNFTSSTKINSVDG